MSDDRCELCGAKSKNPVVDMLSITVGADTEAVCKRCASKWIREQRFLANATREVYGVPLKQYVDLVR